MPFIETSIKDLVIFEPRVFEDSRGYFFESYNKNVFKEVGIHQEFVQDNQSFSARGTIRGIHFQTGIHAQAKLVRVLEGEVLDVAVDLRPESPTFGKHFSILLSSENKKQLYLPRGFGHGFSVLSETAIFSYKCDNFYNKEAEAGIKFDDRDLAIDWKIPTSDATVSEKDIILPSFNDYKSNIGKL